ncbi:MAG: DUF896 domain-containing protein [Bacilli bacterium]
MISDELIKRINELSRKSKEQGLSDAEQEEQSRLRIQYVAAFRSSMKSQLDSIKVVKVDDDGKLLQ